MFGVCIRSSWKLRLRTRLNSFSSAAQGETKNLVSIPASEVAAAIGKNEYKPSSELLEVLWKRFSPNTFTGITKIEEEQEAFAKMPLDAQRALTEALKVPAQNATDVQRTISGASEVVLQNQNLSDADKSKVLEMMKRNVSTRFGLANEDRVVRTVAAREKVKFTRETAVLVIPLCDIGDTRYVVRGKIDRLQEEGDEMILVEVKSRVKGLFKEVRPYEAIQIQTYLQMLPPKLNVKRAKLLEMYQDESYAMFIDKDDDLWASEIRPALLQFCQTLHGAMNT